MSAHEDPHVVNALSSLCEDLGVTTLVQVGAGDGYEADFIRASIGCRAVCIEGDSRQKAIVDDLEYHYTVIGATDGTMPFYQHPTPDLSGHFPRADLNEKMIEVEQQRLDTFCGGLDIVPDALIIDTEGSTMEVLEGCGGLIDGLKVVYAECQTVETRIGIRLLDEVDDFLAARGMTQHEGLPTYDGGAQGNWTWVRT